MLSDDQLCSHVYDHQAAVEFVDDLPGGIVSAFSYGSAVFSQASAAASTTGTRVAPQSMMDIIVIVRNAMRWHEEVCECGSFHAASLLR